MGSYASIPQANATLKKLAIDSLAIYASACRYFITLAPDATHFDTLAPCDEESYSKRGWCRLEQWANATSGFTGMFVFGRKRVLEPISSTETMKDSVFVFEGDFTIAADKYKIVDTVLGLWSIVLANRGDSSLLDRVELDRERVFPKAYCGELPDLVQEQMAEQPTALTEKEPEVRMVKRKSLDRTGLLSDRAAGTFTDVEGKAQPIVGQNGSSDGSSGKEAAGLMVVASSDRGGRRASLEV